MITVVTRSTVVDVHGDMSDVCILGCTYRALRHALSYFVSRIGSRTSVQEAARVAFFLSTTSARGFRVVWRGC